MTEPTQISSFDEDTVLLKLNEIWGCALPFGWIPITGNKKILNTEIYDSTDFSQYIDVIKGVLTSKFKLLEIFEVIEGGGVSVKKISDCDLFYSGIEYLYTDSEYQFVIYCSHEGSVTIGGSALISEIHKIWGDYKNHLWI
jgi:hypothetical protein